MPKKLKHYIKLEETAEDIYKVLKLQHDKAISILCHFFIRSHTQRLDYINTSINEIKQEHTRLDTQPISSNTP